MKAAREQKAAIEEIERVGGHVSYDYEWWNKPFTPTPQPPWPAWIYRRLGIDYLAEVRGVNFSEGRTEISLSGLQQLEGFSHLQFLDLYGTTVADARLEHLKGLTELRWLILRGTKASDAGLENLKGLTELEFLDLSDTKVSDEGVRKLQKALPNTEIEQ